ncbi:hypothetical protein M758_UG321900 [Ceratodon purpureus]|nr:hypothetical protein M758_UG321900 [Ceratodon purpureus]
MLNHKSKRKVKKNQTEPRVKAPTAANFRRPPYSNGHRGSSPKSILPQPARDFRNQPTLTAPGFCRITAALPQLSAFNLTLSFHMTTMTRTAAASSSTATFSCRPSSSLY